MNDKTREALEKYLIQAEKLEDASEFDRWGERVAQFLEQTLGGEATAEFRLLGSPDNSWDNFAIRRGHIEGLLARDDAPSNPETSAPLAVVRATTPSPGSSRRVFVVHGHDDAAKETVARFIDRLGLQAVILHEQPNEGRTIIEKFEVSSSEVAFAVVLLTPDDLGCPNIKGTDLHPRARQNVILELGYFMGKLSRMRVCALYKEGVDLPSDYQGVVYIPLDAAGGWRTKLAQEFVQAKLVIKVEALLGM